MTPENLTQWMEAQIEIMIRDAIEKYDGINTRRHEEHNKKLDRLTYLILGTLLTAASGLVIDLIIHATGK